MSKVNSLLKESDYDKKNIFNFLVLNKHFTSCVKSLEEYIEYSKTYLKRPLSKRSKNDFQDQLLLNAGQNCCKMVQGSIVQYFRPALIYHLSLRFLFCLFLSDHLRQVLLYYANYSLLNLKRSKIESHKLLLLIVLFCFSSCFRKDLYIYDSRYLKFSNQISIF